MTLPELRQPPAGHRFITEREVMDDDGIPGLCQCYAGGSGMEAESASDGGPGCIPSLQWMLPVPQLAKCRAYFLGKWLIIKWMAAAAILRGTGRIMVEPARADDPESSIQCFELSAQRKARSAVGKLIGIQPKPPCIFCAGVTRHRIDDILH